MIAPIVSKVQSKCGSTLGDTEVACFPMDELLITNLPDLVASITPSSDDCEYVRKEVLTYTQTMMENAKQGKVQENMYIQPPTFSLIKKLVTHFLPNSGVECSNGVVEITYTTQLLTSKGLMTVNGQTDLVITTGGVPVGNIEVKNLNNKCSTSKELGEILAEDKGLAKQHRECIGIEPRLFPSVLVSGMRWVFVDRSFDGAGERYLVFPVLETFNEVADRGLNEYSVNEPNVLMVSRLLIRMIHAIKLLMKAAGKMRNKTFNVYRAGFDNSEDGRDDSGGQLSDHDEDTEGPVKGPTAPATTKRPTPSATTSNKKAKYTDGKSTQSTLTTANMFRHELDTMWQRAIKW